MKILIVDDEKTTLDAVRDMLAEDGHTVCTATNLEGALSVINKETIQLIFLDIVLADGESGLTLLDKVKDIPIVMLSANVEPETIVNAMKRGAVNYLTKPTDLDKLFALIKEYES